MITAEQHLAATFAPLHCRAVDGEVYRHERFAEPDESQSAALKRWRAAEKRRYRAPDPQRFPAFKPGHTTTAEYLRCFQALSESMLPIQWTRRLADLAPFYTEPEVVDESEVTA